MLLQRILPILRPFKLFATGNNPKDTGSIQYQALIIIPQPKVIIQRRPNSRHLVHQLLIGIQEYHQRFIFPFHIRCNVASEKNRKIVQQLFSGLGFNFQKLFAIPFLHIAIAESSNTFIDNPRHY